MSAGVRAGATVEVDDAYVRESADGRQWAVGNRAIQYQIGLDASGALVVRSLARPDRESVVVAGVPDAAFAFEDQVVGLGDRAFRFLAAEAAVVNGRAELTLAFALRDRALTVGRHYAVAPGAPVVEMWTSVHGEEATTLRDLEGVRLEVTARDAWWFRGHDTSDDDGGPFTRQARRLDEGQHVEFGSAMLSSQEALPWFGFTAGDTHVLLGIAWSGGWRAAITGGGPGTSVRLGLPDMSVVVQPDRPIEYPHAFVAVTGTAPGDDGRAIAAWLLNRRQGRGYPALVTYNTWFTLGIHIDDEAIRREMDSFAEVGGELFQLDAGWYPPIDAQSPFDFGAGLGSWTVDRARFPEGLGVLADHAHERGLRFGVWVEPERVDMRTVGQPGLAEARFLAQQDGLYQPGRDNREATHGQICLADEAAWTWVRDRLFAFLDAARPDYLKIDLNGWLVCTRADHDHTTDGGNHGHVAGLYRLLSALRDRYPDMAIENCAGGARRLDAEMLTRTDASWMDDRTAPAARVRHHVETLSQIAPPAALLSYLLPHADEPMLDAEDLPLLGRSRMGGVFGLAIDFRGMSELDHNLIASQIAQFKNLRSWRGQGFSALLTDPVGVRGDGPGWDVLQQVNPATDVATILAVRNAGGERRVRVVLTHLRPGADYRIRSVDRGVIGRASADDLMRGGFDIDESATSAAQLFVFEPE